MAEEKLREASCLGDITAVKQLVQAGVDVNSQNTVNGWTALHWACKRNHHRIVEYLIQNGANASIRTNDGNIPSELTKDNTYCTLSITPNNNGEQSPTLTTLPIIPNYIKYPVFPYSDRETPLSLSSINISDASEPQQPRQHTEASVCTVIKARVADSDEEDFVEIELENCTSFENLKKTICGELELGIEDVKKIRKLPNILVRKDKDVLKLSSNDYLEIVLK